MRSLLQPAPGASTNVALQDLFITLKPPDWGFGFGVWGVGFRSTLGSGRLDAMQTAHDAERRAILFRI